MATQDTTQSVNVDENGVVISHSINAEQLRGVSSFDDALALMRETYGDSAIALASEVLGDGFALTDNKDQLCGVGLAFISWLKSDGDFGDFLAARVVTEDGRKFVITDGSTGIYQQLMTFAQERGRMGGLVAKNGLRRSDYTYTDSEGKERPAVTYYIDTSA